ncbi:MAG: putative glycolipid-binding domain-containing protein [Chloroflexota bacterium]
MADAIMWSALAWPGTEHVIVNEGSEGVVVDSFSVALIEGVPSRTSYRLRLAENYAIRRVELNQFAVEGDPGTASQRIALETDGEGNWTGQDTYEIQDFAGARDIDISITPYTNTLPIRRIGFEPQQSEVVKVVWLRVPQMEVVLVRHRYTCLEWSENGGKFTFESLDTGYTTEILVDGNGVVIDYPDLFHRIWPALR